MKKLVLTTLFACSVMLAFAQQDPKAKSILDNVTKTTQSLSTMQASFNYIMENKEVGIREENKGTFIMKGNKYQLKLPLLGLEIYCDGSKVWTYMKDANEVTIAAMGDEDSGEMMNPSKIFTIYQSGFNYKFIEEKALNGLAVSVIDLIPTTKDIEYSKIRVYVDKQKSLIQKAEMYGKDGNSYIIDISDLKTNVAAADNSFMFDAAKHPGVDVIDMR